MYMGGSIWDWAALAPHRPGKIRYISADELRIIILDLLKWLKSYIRNIRSRVSNNLENCIVVSKYHKKVKAFCLENCMGVSKYHKETNVKVDELIFIEEFKQVQLRSPVGVSEVMDCR
ncbi:hypothetical protein RND81_05G002100 [Saponaria officinalis]|uniref:Uncharacterized protein n=1 Tax=Saponaria officinalis TaxID=3572 RepID=A0AAW1KT51_SAPOF